MNLSHKHVVVPALVIGILTLSFLLVTTVFDGTSAAVYTPEVDWYTSTSSVDAAYYVTVANEVVFTSDTLNQSEAESHCESIAFDPQYMWKQVICTLKGKEIYNDVFVAG